MNKKIRIALDGPSGAGKSTIAKNVANTLGIDYIDTGAMYRAVAYKIIQSGLDVENKRDLVEMLENTDIDFSKGNIILDGIIINDKIRTSEITKMASICSAYSEVREKLVSLQRKMGQSKSIIMDGRDIGNNVLKDAEYKFFMTASTKERAKRRWIELTEKGENITLEDVEEDIRQRDYKDTTRELNPLCKSDDAIEIDTTGLSIEDVTKAILDKIK
ncbi:(d)CMP kinase [Anaerovorax odorimutans]|uniref:(d)CMP kinase n=1 Tax=Anaerovorax odorimutans TaxID=109327 RepID=UPI000409840C|nr:(d)CMP kinase [Anaerovorax odorimutans]